MRLSHPLLIETARLLMRTMIVLLCLVGGTAVKAQSADTIFVQTNANRYAPGDTIFFDVTLNNYLRKPKAATVQLWIEDIKTGQRWKYRYPLVNGYLSAKLAIDSNMQAGTYAFNFLLQKAFFRVTGTVRNAAKDLQVLNYVMIARNNQTRFDAVKLDQHKAFDLGPMLFQDSAFIMFSRPAQRQSDLIVDIRTQLDSTFIASYVDTKLIQIGGAAAVNSDAPGTPAAYSFKQDSTPFKIILPEVVIKTTAPKKVEQFAKENVSGMFSSDDAIILDGLGSDEIANAPDLYTYLSIKVGGLRVQLDEQTGDRTFMWRNHLTEIYINEIRLDPDIPIYINPSDIALIKVFRPGTVLSTGSGAGGAICIYTKTKNYQKSNERNYSFYLLGYTALQSCWK